MRSHKRFEVPRTPEAASRRVELGRKAIEIRWKIDKLHVRKLELQQTLMRAEDEHQTFTQKGIFSKGLIKEIEQTQELVAGFEESISRREAELQRVRAQHRQLLGR